MGSVAIRDVRKAYGSVEVLHGVSIDIADGAFVVLVGPSGDPEGHAAEIVTVEPTGSETQVLLRLAGQDVVGVFRERIADRPGEVVKVSAAPDRIHLFDGQSGQRIVPE